MLERIKGGIKERIGKIAGQDVRFVSMLREIMPDCDEKFASGTLGRTYRESVGLIGNFKLTKAVDLKAPEDELLFSFYLTQKLLRYREQELVRVLNAPVTKANKYHMIEKNLNKSAMEIVNEAIGDLVKNRYSSVALGVRAYRIQLAVNNLIANATYEDSVKGITEIRLSGQIVKDWGKGTQL